MVNEDRIIEIETKVLYQEDTIEQLNQVVVEQDKQIRKLKEALELLTRNFKSVLEMTQEHIKPGHERPPHY